MTEFAILAPVPLEHLDAGQDILAKESYVAFGSRKFELFRAIDERRNGEDVSVLIYPSHEDNQVGSSFKVSWLGWYVGKKETHNGRHPLGMKHRPPTTRQNPADNTGYWAVFWHVSRLVQLAKSKCFPISELQTIKDGWRKNAPPRGPELVAKPEFIDFPE